MKRSWLPSTILGSVATVLAVAIVSGIVLAACGGSDHFTQASLSMRSVATLTVDGLKFKDLDKNGKLDPYEDWRLPASERADDLIGRMSVEEKVGQMMHLEPNMTDDGLWDMSYMSDLILNQHITTMISRLSVQASQIADIHNQLQAIAEIAPLGIPISLSSDPRNQFDSTAGLSVPSGAFSQWPDPLGLAATGDPVIASKFGDVVRQEHLAVGIRIALSPQADLTTEPRWSRMNGTFGEDKELVRKFVKAYVSGVQGGSKGLQLSGLVAVAKHFGGYGAEPDGFDAHAPYGRYLKFPGHNFSEHLYGFLGAFDAQVGSVMPTYGAPVDLTLDDGTVAESVGAAFSTQMISGLLRGKYGFNGVVLSDWNVTQNCIEECLTGAPAGVDPMTYVAKFGTPWGVEGLSIEDRYVKAVNAGVDQFGGQIEPSELLNAVQTGRISVARLNEAVKRILVQKFQLGLFENPYVDTVAADSVVGNATFLKAALDAQHKSIVLLQNSHGALPFASQGKKVYLYNVDATVATSYGFTVVTDPAQADLAILRVSAPSQSLHPTYMFASDFPEGRVDFEDGDDDYEAIKAARSAPISVVAVYMSRQAVLTNVVDKADAVLAHFGLSDAALLDVLTGAVAPSGKLPFQLPSSMASVEAQLDDVPGDLADPLFERGFGLSW